jgi:hypothetical protein
MAINSQHVTGFVIGLGAAAAGFYFYKKNQKQVDEWLRKQGIELPAAAGGDYGNMSLEDLVHEKENLEDLIAEREYAAEEETTRTSTSAKPKRKPAAKKRNRKRAKG